MKKKKHSVLDLVYLPEPEDTCSQVLSEILNHWSELWRFQALLKTLLQLVLITSSNMTTRVDEEGLLSAISIFFCQTQHRCEDKHIGKQDSQKRNQEGTWKPYLLRTTLKTSNMTIIATRQLIK